MQSHSSKDTDAPRRSFFADLMGGIADLVAPLWRGWWDKRYYRGMLTQSSVAVFSFLVVFVALGWYARSPIVHQMVVDSALNSVFIEDGRLVSKAGTIVLQNPKTNLPMVVICPDDALPEDLAKKSAQAPVVATRESLTLISDKNEKVTHTYRELLGPRADWKMTAEFLKKNNAYDIVRRMADQQTNQIYLGNVIVELIVRTCEAVLLGLVLWAMLRAAGVSIAASIRLAIVAMAPGLLANLVADLAGITPLSGGWSLVFSPAQLPFWVLTVLYLCFAVFAVRSAPKEHVR